MSRSEEVSVSIPPLIQTSAQPQVATGASVCSLVLHLPVLAPRVGGGRLFCITGRVDEVGVLAGVALAPLAAVSA